MPFDGIPYRDSRLAAPAAHGAALDIFNKQLQIINYGLCARTYDNDYRVTAITDTGSATVQSLAYTYDDNDNARIIRNNTALNTTETLRFDSVDRLVFASGGYGTVSSITYDSNGNRLTYGATTYTISGTSNRLTNDGTNAVGYIATGNINSIGADSMTYNKANQLATATVSGTTSTYTYDAFGQRAKYVVGAGTAVVQQYDPNNVNLLMEKGSSETDYIYLDPESGGAIPIAAVNPSTPATSYIHSDHLGTPKKATNSGQTVVWTGTYQPFGTVTPTASVTMNLRFPGQYADSTGFYHNGFRDYVPSYGRYLQSDPIGIYGGINTYNYALNNPYAYTDPEGLTSFVGTVAKNCAKSPVRCSEIMKEGTDTAIAIGSMCMAAANMMPPGDCTPEEHNELQGRVENACGAATKCLGTDDVGTVNRKIGNISQCINARKTINEKCFKGGNPGHNMAILERVLSIKRCERQLTNIGMRR